MHEVDLPDNFALSREHPERQLQQMVVVGYVQRAAFWIDQAVMRLGWIFDDPRTYEWSNHSGSRLLNEVLAKVRLDRKILAEPCRVWVEQELDKHRAFIDVRNRITHDLNLVTPGGQYERVRLEGRSQSPPRFEYLIEELVDLANQSMLRAGQLNALADTTMVDGNQDAWIAQHLDDHEAS